MPDKSKSCSKCAHFVPIKNRKHWEDRIGICDYEDVGLHKEEKNCPNFHGKKYHRKKKEYYG